MSYPFEVSYTQVQADVEPFIDVLFGALHSSFLLLPRGQGFITYSEFQQAYEVLKRHTAGEDMRKLLEATQGKVFTLSTLDQLVENTDLEAFRSLNPF